MRTLTVWCVAAVSVLASSAWAKPKPERERSPDVLRVGGASAPVRPNASAPTVDDVGDVDSFGRNVQYLGVTQTANVELATDCTPDPNNPPGPNDRCIVLAAAPGTTTVDEEELATMNLPAKATHSLICFAVTPFITFEFNNTTGVPQPSAVWNLRPTIRIENEVLNDPALIDPTTGAPFAGAITVALGTYSENRSLAVDERATRTTTQSRACIAGIISKNALTQTYGLSDSLASQFFKKPISLHFGASGLARLIDFGNYFYGIRLYGD